MNKLIIVLIVGLFLFGCAHSNSPVNIASQVQYEHDLNLCLNTESYRQCMEKLGYKY